MAKRYSFSYCNSEIKAVGCEQFLRNHKRSPRLAHWVEFLIAQDAYTMKKKSVSIKSYSELAFDLFVKGEYLTVGRGDDLTSMTGMQYKRFLSIIRNNAVLSPLVESCVMHYRNSNGGRLKHVKFLKLNK